MSALESALKRRKPMHDARARDGRYTKSVSCDACGKPCGTEYFTDDEVCNGSDGPGFYLCARVRCGKKYEGLGIEERRALYTGVRAKS